MSDHSPYNDFQDSIGKNTEKPEVKRQKLENQWVPPSVTQIEEPWKFDSCTYKSKIPAHIKDHCSEPCVIGVDEAGRGPVLGPMVYGVSYCQETYQDELQKKYGFADSKTLKEDKRKDLFREIESPSLELNSNVGWLTTTMTAKDISSGMLQSTLKKSNYNLNEQAHDVTIRLIKELFQSGLNFLKLFVDTVGPPETYQAKLQKIFPSIEIVVAKKADSYYPIVSTASVVAKVTRDCNLQYFAQQLPALTNRLVGSGYPSDSKTSAWISENVDPVFGWHFGLVRFSWQTAKDILLKSAVPVVYEEECIEEYDNKNFFNYSSDNTKDPKASIDNLFYCFPVLLL